MEDIDKIVMIAKFVEDIKYPWWCFTWRLRSFYMVKQLRIKRNEYQETEIIPDKTPPWQGRG